jgi:hypothetical protein
MVHSPGSQGKTDSRVPGSSRPATQLDPTAAAGILTKATHFSLVFSTERVSPYKQSKASCTPSSLPDVHHALYSAPQYTVTDRTISPRRPAVAHT